MKRVSAIVALVGTFFIVLLAFPTAVRLLADWWWFSDVGFEQVFVKMVTTKVVLGAITAVVAFVFFYVNFWTAQRGVVPDPLVVNINAKAQTHVDVTKALRTLALPGSIVLAFLVGLSASGSWLTVLRFLNRTPFGQADPVFGRDIGYYVFTLPGIAGMIGLIQALTILSLFLVLPLYLMRGDIVFLRNKPTVEPSAQMHVGILAAMLFAAAAAATFFVRIPSLVYSTTGPLYGASASDLAARLPIMRLSGYVAILCAVWVVFSARQLTLVRGLAITTIAYLGISGVLGTLVPSAYQKLLVVPNELARETPQLEHHVTATRSAWQLDGVSTRTLSGELQLSLQDIQANSGTVKNVRLWDREPLLQTFGQLQEIRTYYDFVEVDDDRYWIDGEYRQVLLSPRELNTASLPTRTFINERLTFTHGMGVTLSPANQVSPEGLPNLFVKDLPPSSTVSLSVTRPEIYYGELSSDYVFVNTLQPEFDYPSGDSSATTVYQGTGGVRIGGLFRKAVLSARFSSLKVLLSSDITSGSRVLYHRNVRERAAKALPFLQWDADPYMVITEEGRLKWMMDAYTVTDRYPYSQPLTNGINYMRNSVKVVIDAYDGDITAYVADPDDPIIQTYSAIYPDIMTPMADMPADLRQHVRYPEDLFRAQTALYQIYHMDQPEVFYHREDQWQVPGLTGREATTDPFLRHIIMKLPGEEREEFIFMVPFTPRGKDNLAAWMVARNDGEHYGELVVYRFPRQSLVFGPTQIVNRMNQNTEISRQISLWDQRGSEVIRGNLLVIPIEEALVFVQAVYLRAEGGRIPELKRVIVAYENQVAMEETLDQGLARLFGGSVSADTPGMTLPIGSAAEDAEGEAGPAPRSLTLVADAAAIDSLAAEAAHHYDRALAAQRIGDWATYGIEIDLVGQLLQRIRDAASQGRGSQ